MSNVIHYRDRMAKAGSALLNQIRKASEDPQITEDDMEMLVYHHLLPGLEYLAERAKDIAWERR